ncbi:MAG: ketopantoate reductase family protein [Vicinamibacterales bacterium]
MKIAVVGSGAVGGYYGARLAHAGQEVTFVARGAQLRALRERGLLVWSPLGDLQVHALAESDTSRVGPVDAVLFAVKTYDLDAAAAMLPPLLGPATVVLTLQNGVDAPEAVAKVVQPAHVLGGTTYIGTSLLAPGVIEQVGTRRLIVFGEAFGGATEVTPRVRALADVLLAAEIQVEAVANVQAALWEKLIFLAPLAGFTASTRLAMGGVWSDAHIRQQILETAREIERVARAAGVGVRPDVVSRMQATCDKLPANMRTSMLMDITAGKPLEVEALLGSVVRRGQALGVPTPQTSTLYAVLKPLAGGRLA